MLIKKTIALFVMLSGSVAPLYAQSAMQDLNDYTEHLEKALILHDKNSIDDYARALTGLILDADTSREKLGDEIRAKQTYKNNPLDKQIVGKSYGFRDTEADAKEKGSIYKAITTVALTAKFENNGSQLRAFLSNAWESKGGDSKHQESAKNHYLSIYKRDQQSQPITLGLLVQAADPNDDQHIPYAQSTYAKTITVAKATPLDKIDVAAIQEYSWVQTFAVLPKFEIEELQKRFANVVAVQPANYTLREPIESSATGIASFLQQLDKRKYIKIIEDLNTNKTADALAALLGLFAHYEDYAWSLRNESFDRVAFDAVDAFYQNNQEAVNKAVSAKFPNSESYPNWVALRDKMLFMFMKKEINDILIGNNYPGNSATNVQELVKALLSIGNREPGDLEALRLGLTALEKLDNGSVIERQAIVAALKASEKNYAQILGGNTFAAVERFIKAKIAEGRILATNMEQLPAELKKSIKAHGTLKDFAKSLLELGNRSLITSLGELPFVLAALEKLNNGPKLGQDPIVAALGEKQSKQAYYDYASIYGGHTFYDVKRTIEESMVASAVIQANFSVIKSRLSQDQFRDSTSLKSFAEQLLRSALYYTTYEVINKDVIEVLKKLSETAKGKEA